jgi:hypothetical protein
MQQNTDTGAGFTSAKNMLAAHGRASNDGQLTILITDGKPNRGVNPKTVSDSMKAIGIEIFGIGVGPSVDAAEIQTWVTAPTTGHYFAATNWAALNTILQDLVKNACKHPPVEDDFLLSGPNPAKNCLFHLPGGLPQTRRRLVAAKQQKAVELEVAPLTIVSPAVVDACNNYTTCEDCIGQRTSHSTCGWCTGDVSYEGKPSTAKCAGKETSGASKWTCTGHYQTSSCSEPASCGLDGIYRGLRIDNSYEFGEWSAIFTPGKGSEQATFKFLDPAGSPTSVSGTIKCDKKCEEGTDQNGVKFTFTSGTDIQHGICGFTNQVQSQTAGLMWAISDKGVATAPATFDDGMLANGATVYTYYECSKFKSGCKFVAP